MTQYKTPVYQLPYCDANEPVKNWPTIQQGVAERIEKAFGDAQIPPGNPSQNDVLVRLAKLEDKPLVTVDLITTDQVLGAGNAAEVPVVWNKRSGDTTMNPTATPDRLVPPKPGWYEVTATLVFSQGTGGQRNIGFQVWRNGVRQFYRGQNNMSPSLDFYTEVNGTLAVYLTMADYVKITAESNRPAQSISLKADQGTRAAMVFIRP